MRDRVHIVGNPIIILRPWLRRKPLQLREEKGAILMPLQYFGFKNLHLGYVSIAKIK